MKNYFHTKGRISVAEPMPAHSIPLSNREKAPPPPEGCAPH